MATHLDERVSVLLPVRDEARRLELNLWSVLEALSAYGRHAELVVLDDRSRDGSRQLAERLISEHPDVRGRVVVGAPLPKGWLGKPWACNQLAALADVRSTAFVFVDADVTLQPAALGAALSLLRSTTLDLVSPWPRQQAETWSERLVQPLQQWSWLTTVPLRLAERSSRPSLAAANGQLLVVDRAAYERAGGHGAVRSDVLDDIALLRAVVRSGGHGAPVDGTMLASCRMYRGWDEVSDGYTKSLWAAFSSPAGATAVLGGLGLLYVWPAVATLAGSPVGAVGYACGVLGRVVAARRTGGRAWPDSLAHPVSVVLLGWLTARSWRGRRAGTLSWKGRPLL
jgi:glycosyltransferase involved in cell wall biosynthesis